MLMTSGALELLDSKLLFLLWFSRKRSPQSHRYMQEPLNHCLCVLCTEVLQQHHGP